MTISERQALYAAARVNFGVFLAKSFQIVSPSSPFLPNWHIEVVTDRLEQCYRREITRLIITMPPRSLKSICASVAYSAWLLGKDPSHRIICVSYSADLAAKFARDSRELMMSTDYQEMFPKTRIVRRAELDIETTRRGGRYATSPEGTLTGRGGRFIIIDDPLKPQESASKVARDKVKRWFDGTLYSRLDDKENDVIILVMQRLHVDDLVAHLLEREGWIHLNLPAIAETYESFELTNGRRFERHPGDVLHPEREPLSELNKTRETIGSLFFNAQYQQCPVPLEGNLIKWSWFLFYDNVPSPTSGGLIVQSWDTASKATELSDFSVCTTWLIEGNNYYLLDVLRERLGYPMLRKTVLELEQRFKPRTILVEDTVSGTSLIQDLRSRHDAGVPKPTAVTPKGDKTMRMSTQSAKIEAGHIHLPRHASWLDAFKSEILAFPKSAHDDQVDSLSQFLHWIDERNRRTAYVVKLTGY